ncbi:MAG: hypothetical protein ACREOJ_19205 [Gemmatimonadaceae bacterium]
MSIIHPRALAIGLGAILLASCTADVPVAPRPDRARLSLTPAAGKLYVCHKPATKGSILEIGVAGLADHLGHGDYISTLMVSHDPNQPADGAHFTTIQDALAAARASRVAAGEAVAGACRITILVSSGTYQGTIGTASGTLEHFPLMVDMPDVTLHGALAMALDASGRATGQGTSPDETVLSPVEPLPFDGSVSTPIVIANGHPNGSAGNGLTVEGFVFQSGNDPAVTAGGQGILALRVTRLTIRGNRLEGGFTESVDLRASSADVIENHLGGTAGTCDLCLAGPGTFNAHGNRLLAGGIPGVSVSPTVGLPVPAGVEPYELPASAEIWADIRNNEVQDHQRIPVGVGIRMDAVGVSAPNVHGAIHAVVQDNVLVNNRFGMIVHAAFPVVDTDRRGDVDVTLGGNVFQGSCQTNLFVSFARHQTGLGIDPKPKPYLLNSTFNLTLNGNLNWDDVWFSHPDGFGNTLIVDGQVIPNGSRHFYDAAGCPGSSGS